MDQQPRPVDYGGNIIGYCVLAAGIAQFPALLAGYMFGRMPHGNWSLLMVSLPAFVLLCAGGVGLILRRFWGYYLVYIATFFGGIGGLKTPYIPFIKRFINLGPATEDLWLVLNLGIVAILVIEHWSRLHVSPPGMEKAHRAATIGILVIGLTFVAVGRTAVHRERGQKITAADLPVIGRCFTDLHATGTVSHISVETKWPSRGITMVFAGTCRASEIQAIADRNALKEVKDLEMRKKFLPQAKSWKLDPSMFLTTFAAEDSFYIGRLKELPRVSLQLVHSKATDRFTAQILGVVSAP